MSWVEEYVGRTVRIMGILNDRPSNGRPLLVYIVEQDGCDDHGPFDNFDKALAVATSIATASEREAKPGHASPGPSAVDRLDEPFARSDPHRIE